MCRVPGVDFAGLHSFRRSHHFSGCPGGRGGHLFLGRFIRIGGCGFFRGGRRRLLRGGDFVGEVDRLCFHAVRPGHGQLFDAAS